MRVCKRVLTFGLALTMLLLLAIPGFAVPSSEGNAGGSVETGIDTDNSYNLDNDVYFIETDTMLYDENNATHYNPFDLPDTLGEDFKIHYYDSETNEDLEGAEFTIVNSDKEVVARSVYYGNGLYGFENLLELYPSFIEWYLVQTKAPEGYVSMQSIAITTKWFRPVESKGFAEIVDYATVKPFEVVITKQLEDSPDENQEFLFEVETNMFTTTKGHQEYCKAQKLLWDDANGWIPERDAAGNIIEYNVFFWYATAAIVLHPGEGIKLMFATHSNLISSIWIHEITKPEEWRNDMGEGYGESVIESWDGNGNVTISDGYMGTKNGLYVQFQRMQYDFMKWLTGEQFPTPKTFKIAEGFARKNLTVDTNTNEYLDIIEWTAADGTEFDPGTLSVYYRTGIVNSNKKLNYNTTVVASYTNAPQQLVGGESVGSLKIGKSAGTWEGKETYPENKFGFIVKLPKSMEGETINATLLSTKYDRKYQLNTYIVEPFDDEYSCLKLVIPGNLELEMELPVGTPYEVYEVDDVIRESTNLRGWTSDKFSDEGLYFDNVSVLSGTWASPFPTTIPNTYGQMRGVIREGGTWIQYTNKDLEAPFSIQKADADTGELLSGAVFSAYSSPNCASASLICNSTELSDGLYTFDALTVPGTYYITETTPPPDYPALDSYPIYQVEILDDGQITVTDFSTGDPISGSTPYIFHMTNSKDVPSEIPGNVLPLTGGPGILPTTILGIGFVITALKKRRI